MPNFESLSGNARKLRHVNRHLLSFWDLEVIKFEIRVCTNDKSRYHVYVMHNAKIINSCMSWRMKSVCPNVTCLKSSLYILSDAI